MTNECETTINVLLDLTKKLTDELSLEEALEAVTEAALRLLPCDHASVRVFDDSRTALLSSARSGAGCVEGPMIFKRGEGLIGWVAEHGEPTIVSDVLQDARFTKRGGQGFTIKSVLAVPLRAADQVVGVLGATSSHLGTFSTEHEVLATLLANCAVPAIERARLELIRAKLERLAVTDTQTPAFNHRYLLPKLREEIDLASRNVWPLSVLLMDLDNFKGVNDLHGHAIGDRVLRTFADRVLSSVRSSDILVRRGGDEFVLIMPQAPESRAIEVGERVREAVERRPLSKGATKVTGTVSIGVATWTDGEVAEHLEGRADQAMYQAKRTGRNCVVRSKNHDLC